MATERSRPTRAVPTRRGLPARGSSSPSSTAWRTPPSRTTWRSAAAASSARRAATTRCRRLRARASSTSCRQGRSNGGPGPRITPGAGALLSGASGESVCDASRRPAAVRGRDPDAVMRQRLGGGAAGRTAIPVGHTEYVQRRPRLPALHRGRVARGARARGLAQGAEVFITYDTGNPDTTHGGGHVYAVLLGNAIDPTRDNALMDHYSALAGIEDAFSLPRLRSAKSATPVPF